MFVGLAEYPLIRGIEPPLTRSQLRPLHPECRVVQFSTPLAESDHRKLAVFLRDYPQVTFRVFGHYGKPCDLGFLRHYAFVRHLAVDVYTLDDLNGINCISGELESFTLGQTKRRHALAFLQRFPRLRTLFLEGHTKDIDVIGGLSQLEDLTLRSITLPDLAILKPLDRLLSLDIKLGGTRDLGLLPGIGRLRYLELWMIRGLCNLEPIAAVRSLQCLFLQALKNVTKLPSFAGLRSLRRVHIETMKGLSDLRPVGEAPTLEELVAIDMRHLKPEAFRCFVGHPTLRRVSAGLGSLRKNAAVTQLLGMPGVEGEFVFDDSANAC